MNGFLAPFPPFVRATWKGKERDVWTLHPTGRKWLENMLLISHRPAQSLKDRRLSEDVWALLEPQTKLKNGRRRRNWRNGIEDLYHRLWTTSTSSIEFKEFCNNPDDPDDLKCARKVCHPSLSYSSTDTTSLSRGRRKSCRRCFRGRY